MLTTKAATSFTIMAPMTKMFNKVLIARHSPRNACHVRDGEILFVAPVRANPTAPCRWNFVDSNIAKKSKYGWVGERSGFELSDLLINTENKLRIDEKESFARLQLMMLESVSNLVDGDVVAVDFLSRGIPPQPTLVVHKVIFYG